MTRQWRYALGEIKATDLTVSAQECQAEGVPVETGHITLYRESDGYALSARAEYLYLHGTGRLGIAHGADATWADVKSLETGIETWVNDPEAWEAAN